MMGQQVLESVGEALRGSIRHRRRNQSSAVAEQYNRTSTSTLTLTASDGAIWSGN